MSQTPAIDGVVDLVEIGRGGFGVVYRGTEQELSRSVAVKVLSPTLDETARNRFERERQAMGSLSGHPHIVPVFRTGFTELHQPYIVMEYLPGGSMRDRLTSDGAMAWTEAASVGVKLAGALETSHRAGVLHRDIKPGNIFLSGLGEPKLGDFGIARLQGGNETRSSSITASVAHAPPEVVAGQRPDERADLYSLASTLYELVAGTPAFVRPDEQSLVPMLARIASDDVPDIDLGPDSGAFLAAIHKAMSKDPDRRQGRVAVFGEALRSAQLSAGVPASRMLVDGGAPDPAPLDRTATQKIAPPSASPLSEDELYTPVAAAPVTGPTPVPAPTNMQSVPAETTQGGLAGRIPLLAGIGALMVVMLLAGFWAAGRGDKSSVAAGEENSEGDRQELSSTTPNPDTDDGDVGPGASKADRALPATAVPLATATPIPTATPVPTPTPVVISYATVSEEANAISMSVPQAWTLTTQSTTEYPLTRDLREIGVFYRAISAGGGLRAFQGPADGGNLTVEGVSVTAFRSGIFLEDADLAELLRLELENWQGCLRRDTETRETPAGTANIQHVGCQVLGYPLEVAVYSIVHRDDPGVRITGSLQLFDDSDMEPMARFFETVTVDPALVELWEPTADASDRIDEILAAQEIPTPVPAPDAPITSGYVKVIDDSGTISASIPTDWTHTVTSAADDPFLADLATLGLFGEGLAVGGVFSDFAPSDDDTYSGVPGVSIYAFRSNDALDPINDILDGEVEAWGGCLKGIRSDIPTPAGTARLQVFECETSTGTMGVTVYVIVHKDDPAVLISGVMQLTDIDNVEPLAEFLTTLQVDPDLVPAMDLNLEAVGLDE